MSPQRVLGVAATAALLAVGVACLLLILGTGADEEDGLAALATATATATATPDPTPTPKPTPPPLTAAGKQQRAAAAAVLRANGFEPVSLSPYRGDRELRVLIGRRIGMPPGTASRRAFFFVGPQFVGTDTQDLSGRIVAERNGERTVTLAYGRYEPGDALLDPSGRRRVRFVWTGTTLSPETAIPPLTERAPQATG